tara:strand:- start:1567 stop:1740 length:174 start_codon:yes stop_codon:yes gene_type:complete
LLDLQSNFFIESGRPFLSTKPLKAGGNPAKHKLMREKKITSFLLKGFANLCAMVMLK